MADREKALARLRHMVAADERPSLSADALHDLLDGAAIRDADGLLPTDTGWTTTWDLDRAAADGWRWKAGQVAGDFTFSADGGSFSKGEVLAHCEAMADHYAARGLGSVTVTDDRTHPAYATTRLLVN